MRLNLAVLRLAIAAIALAALAPASAQTQPTSTPTAAKPPAYYISEFELMDPDGIKPYSAAVESTFQPFGGKYAVRGGKVVSLEGEPSKRIIMIVFPSLEQARAWYASPRYQEIMPIRHKSAKSRVFIMEGFPN